MRCCSIRSRSSPDRSFQVAIAFAVAGRFDGFVAVVGGLKSIRPGRQPVRDLMTIWRRNRDVLM